MRYPKRQTGFTIIELMFATVVFSIILMLALAALVQIGKLYYKGVTTSQTQQVARNVMDELSQSIQLSAGTIRFPAPPAGPDIIASSAATGVFCIGDTRYSYAIDRQLTEGTPVAADKQISHVLWADELTNCGNIGGLAPLDLTQTVPVDGAGNPGKNGRELLGAHMRLLRLEISQPVASNNNVWQLDLSVAYGDEDLFTIDTTPNPDRKYCKTAESGTQFCATSELSTIINRRIVSLL